MGDGDKFEKAAELGVKRGGKHAEQIAKQMLNTVDARVLVV